MVYCLTLQPQLAEELFKEYVKQVEWYYWFDDVGMMRWAEASGVLKERKADLNAHLER